MQVQGPQKLVIMLCKFSDSPTIDPHPTAFYEDLFINRGTGGLNDYWIAASLNTINLGGSTVFGWKTLDVTRSDFLTAHPTRGDKVRGALEAFGLKSSDYVASVAIFDLDTQDGGTEPPDLILAHHGAGDCVNVTFLAHETGHVFGLEHSFDRSNRQVCWAPGECYQKGEYFDRHDIMSAMTADSDIGHRFSPRGPLLNVPNLQRMGWMPGPRVWQALKNSTARYEVDIVALEYPEVPGYLAAKAGGWVAEFRIPRGFDSGLARPAVLFHHELAEPNSVIIASDPEHFVHEWLRGQVHGNPSLFQAFGGTRATVVSFDLVKKTARILIEVRATRPPFVRPKEYYELGIGQLLRDGKVLVVSGGKIVLVPVPPPRPEPISPEVGIGLREHAVSMSQEDLAIHLPSGRFRGL